MTDDRSLGIFINMQGGASNQGLAALDRAGRVPRFFVGLALLIAAPGCAANSYMGIPLARGGAGAGLQSGAAEPSLQLLATRARAGDKQAQLDLGIRFEEGRGVTASRSRATSLYKQAARDTGGALWIYSPGIGQAKGRTIPIDTGPRRAGLPEAKDRLHGFTVAGAAIASDSAFEGPNGVRAPARARDLVSASDMVAQAQEVPIGPREEGVTLLRACRSKLDLDNGRFSAAAPFEYGYCQGYVLSKVHRLSTEQSRALEARRQRTRREQAGEASWIMLDILTVLRSSRFDDRNFAEFKGRFAAPITAENVLDYVIDELLYVEQR